MTRRDDLLRLDTDTSLEDDFPSDLLHVVAREGAHGVEVVTALAFEALYELAHVGSVVVLGRRGGCER